ncbi:MAG TPA: glycerol-3-phosphate 1-O-acyltransferase PlsY [Plasticicumulans sp.]|uniref:glycerol-3-phosphate 1-O-acyltransferase PlsY n=1 Tax=Plasticicumulans sp. TaxID=2307179 RepID=UPI002CC62519|nr:glycerol-3-phosphate 1-O-acyltransferase PlsY [Plasticicumulans sp.]MBS0601496.1 glycerol-3-phosphate 1-O-acyltransferase PlsY [Pseudomonadota bacterium]HMX53562.1 glycerol-3-phosphate 1-O-acyltransferase PlsY [Plasticicumulans sp.]HMZ11135.1 glycerol-3-phosphate 1-O-acyltransferase PlsY [Plasticicumulans sp.]HNB90080.1 glycerol-3-phosphate 1-O-acyltransferase PlsY [Plasticicumulans sp.]HNF66336.1 glycerol-3-phosphate 1-O-acyltransferase PlsY [Plasticicumulans sp.]
MTSALLCLVFAYLCGSVSTAILVCRLMGLPDPRSEGSRNPGATNVLRIGGRKAAAITLAGDFLKGLIPVLVARAFGQGPEVLAATAFAAFLGHLYPVFFGFQGGKGVATALGVMVGLSWQVALAALATWLVIARVWKISSLAALGAATLSPLYALLFGLPGAYALALLPMVALLLWRHRENIRRIRAGTESRIGDKKKT